MADALDYDDDEVPEILARRFLPAPLADHWLVLPKRLLQWAAVNILLLGAAGGSLLTALTATFVPIKHLDWGVVVVIALVYLIRKFILTPIERDAIDEARRALNQSDPTG